MWKAPPTGCRFEQQWRAELAHKGKSVRAVSSLPSRAESDAQLAGATGFSTKYQNHNFLLCFAGVGAGMVIISFIGSIYYNMIIGWALYYMFASFQKVLPWQGCDHDYNTPGEGAEGT